MAISIQNKNYLSLLCKLDIDVKQFPDITFDGLFDNIPKDTNYFFNWFLENITPDNVLTQSEESIYFELEKNKKTSTEDEINYILSSCNPTFEELYGLDVNYIKSFLPGDLEGQQKFHEELSTICLNLESNYNEIKKKHNSVKESISKWKKLLAAETENCNRINESYNEKLENVKKFLLTLPNININFDYLSELLTEEENIFNMFRCSNLLQNDRLTGLDVALLHKLEEDLAYVDVFVILSDGCLKAKKNKLDYLSELEKKIQKKLVENFNFILASEGMSTNFNKEIDGLERKLLEGMKDVSYKKIQIILEQFLVKKTDLHRTFLSKCNNCRNYVKSNHLINSWLLHILIKCNIGIHKTFCLRKELQSRLNEYKRNITNDLSNLELRRRRFKEMSSETNQNPILLLLKHAGLEETNEHLEEPLREINHLLLQVTDDSNFITHKFRNGLQASIKSLFGNILCGPTSELLFEPVELLIKFQNCQGRENQLSHEVRRLANKYVEAKDSTSKIGRKRLLLWIYFLSNPSALEIKMKESTES